MTAGSSLFKQIIPVTAAILLTSLAYAGYACVNGTFSMELIAFGLIFFIPASAAFYFRKKESITAQEGDNMRLMLQARAEELGGGSTVSSANLTAELNRTAVICRQIFEGDFETRILNIDPTT